MTTLKERLDRIKTGFLASAPEEAVAIMARAEEELRESGIMSRIPAADSELPAFELPDSAGEPVRSGDLLERGSLVLTFYRGVW